MAKSNLILYLIFLIIPIIFYLNWWYIIDKVLRALKMCWQSPKLLSIFHTAFITMELLKWIKESCIWKNVEHTL